ncbi:hypothetical protein RFI_09007, partial [Reticulomyxa filosa]
FFLIGILHFYCFEFCSMSENKLPKRKLSQINNGESSLESPSKKSKIVSPEEDARKDLVEELRSLLVPCTQEMIENESIDSLLYFDKNDNGETCLWVAMIEVPHVHESGFVLVSFPGYPSETETHTFWIAVRNRGVHELNVYQVSDIVLEKKFEPLLDPNNLKACEYLLKHSTTLDLNVLKIPLSATEDQDKDDAPYYPSWSLRKFGTLQAKLHGINLRALRSTKKKQKEAQKELRKKLKTIQRLRRTARQMVNREDKKEERQRTKATLPKKTRTKPSIKKTKTRTWGATSTAPKVNTSRRPVGGETGVMPAKPEGHNWVLTEFEGQDTMELQGVIPVSHRVAFEYIYMYMYSICICIHVRIRVFVKALKAPPDENNANPDEIEIVFSFDTTASMYRVLETVRNNVAKTISRLFRDIPNLRIGVMAHGDYMFVLFFVKVVIFVFSRDTSYTCRWVDLTKNEEQLVWFVSNVGKTYGGDAPECYELVLHNVSREFSWSETCQARSFVLIGDEVPHATNSNNPYNLDWREKIKDCAACGIKIYSVQCRDQASSKNFYKTCATETEGVYLTLDNLDSFPGMMVAICHREKDLTKEKPRGEEFKKEKDEFKKRCEELEPLSMTDLKDLLRGNGQKVSGTKIELIKRIVDCQMYGCMPVCPQCNTGRLRAIYFTNKAYGHGGKGRFYCPGYYEDAAYHGCTWTGDQSQITRPPWQDKKVTGED